MARLVLRILVLIAGAAVVAAATHANVAHAGGYGSQDAPLIIAIATLLALGMGYVGVTFNEGRRFAAVLLGTFIMCGEAYWVLLNAEREIAARDAIAAPVAEAVAARAEVERRVEVAEQAKRKADAAAISEAAKRDCATNCARLLLAAQETANDELANARAALTALPVVRSVSPLSDRLGVTSWAWDLIMAGLRSLAVLGGALAIGLSLNPRRDNREERIAMPESFEVVPSPFNRREHVSQFLHTALRPDPGGRASLRALHGVYRDWCGGAQRLSPGEFGKELRAIIDALGLKCDVAGNDVVVHGAAISEQASL
ncbi:MAG TPA: hypothetical protein PK271_04820 [Hyphomicrobium sp.]|uniref:hypothetical protein n=1 Tax=Hyphomicrobium sp. TaxID=82 RepID=UPI002BF0E63D|nr:hypothetical protein [Hyphomicrobium sp.]HRN87904.1 hypothetical protein [Hyphomicrobium sp.]